MIKNYITIALRNLLKYKGYSFINISGLAIGIACCLLILLFVQDELSYDRHNLKSSRIYRVVLNGAVGTNEINLAATPYVMGETLKEEFPEVEEFTRIKSYGFPLIRYGDKVFSEERFYWVDSTFFNVFTVEFIKGNPESALTDPNSVVITESTSRKYFNNDNPVGKSINSNNRADYKITAVIKDPPLNSHFHYDFLGSVHTNKPTNDFVWLSNNFHNYILLKPGSDAAELEKKLNIIFKKYVAPQIELATGSPFAEGGKYDFLLQPLTDIHLYSDLENELEPNSDASYVYIFSLIAAIILFVACINFMNLSTARSSNRYKEIGIRKTLGSNKSQLVRQFLVETILMSLIAVLIALFMIEVAVSPFNNLVGKNLEINYLSNLSYLPLLILAAVVVGILAGLYPAFYLSSFNTIKVLRRNSSLKGGNSWLRNSLVVLQFSVSIVLITGTIFVYNQVEFIRNKKLGFNKEQILVVQKTDDIGKSMGTFKEELQKIPGVVNVSNSNTLFGKPFDSNGFKKQGINGSETQILWVLWGDENLADTYELQLIQGRYYSKERSADEQAIVINETAAKNLGFFNDAIGKQIIPYDGSDKNYTIVGVIKDFHFESMQQSIKPIALRLFGDNDYGKYVSVKLEAGNFDNKINDIKKVWHKFAGQQPFEYFFFDNEFANTYKAEEQTGIIVTTFSLLSIFIACLGLLGLSSFNTGQRTKEIGIRKVLGAASGGIVFLLSIDFIKWVAVANIVAWPVTYFLIREWLGSYVYRVEISPWPFIVSACAAVVIALLTISYQAIKAAVANPVDSLKYE